MKNKKKKRIGFIIIDSFLNRNIFQYGIYYKFSRDSKKCEKNYIETRNNIDIFLNILEQNVIYPCELFETLNELIENDAI